MRSQSDGSREKKPTTPLRQRDETIVTILSSNPHSKPTYAAGQQAHAQAAATRTGHAQRLFSLQSSAQTEQPEKRYQDSGKEPGHLSRRRDFAPCIEHAEKRGL